MTFLILSFVAGVLTILAPCILPLLPVIVGHSVTDTTVSKKRLFTVITSLGISVIVFTILLKASTTLIGIPQDFWKWISGGIILIFGLTMVFPNIWESLSFLTSINRKSNKVMTIGYNKNSLWGDIIIGASLGPIFSACSPTYFVILATVLPATPILGLIYLLTYVFGLCLALIFVAFIGQKIVNKIGVVVDPRGWFKKIFGIIFIIVAIGLLTGYDKKLQIKILDAGFLDVTKIEQNLLDKSDDDVNTQIKLPEKVEESTNEDKIPTLSLEEKSNRYILAPDTSTLDGYINTGGKPISVSEFRGKKVVLLDVWTYSCINCQRTIPYLNEWYKKYEDEGLVIIGLHTPEFVFERKQENVKEAVKNFDIKYPVVLDNDFSTWTDYKNRFWPRKYLIDIDGFIVYDHAGEGDYEGTEMAIQKALVERNKRLKDPTLISSGVVDPTNKVSVDPYKVSSPEVYFGFGRNEFLYNGKSGKPGFQTLIIPEEIITNKLYLSGVWNFDYEYAQNEGDGTVLFKYKAKNVYMVTSSDEGSEIEVYLDGKFVKVLFIKNEKLYNIIEGKEYGEHKLELKIKNPNIKIFTFTFG